MAKKLESTFVNMVVVLSVVAMIAGFALGEVYTVTKAPIEQAALKKKLEAISKVTPTFDNDPNSEMFKMAAFEPKAGLDSIEVYPAKKDGKVVGYAVKSYTMNGFSGLIELMVGFNVDGSIVNYSVLFYAETPGLGTKIPDWFSNTNKPNQCIIGKNPSTSNMTVSKDGGDIDAITAATISSRAFLDAVNRAYKTLEQGGKYE
ncbi:MAG: RnfABCDGE type electron transport complex subunit G [Bacteroidales bacterium]|nr:RnfABCDGE type electron transport complex subunit G [Bacteroidales bacterium]